MTNIQLALAQRLTDALQAPLPALTRRDVRLPDVPGKAMAAIGVRRAGKTSFLWQCIGDRLNAGRSRESLWLLGLEDDRLSGIAVSDLDWLLEEYFRRYPALRSGHQVTIALDEIQVVEGWERLARRVIDTEQVELLLSGSSAKLLSREVATSLRGRAMEVLVHPFSFREVLRHTGEEPPAHTELGAAARSALDHRLRDYLTNGGFPEAQGLALQDHLQLLRGYVDVVVLRDVIERHAVSNITALRWLQRQLLSTPAGSFSVKKLFDTMRSQGIAVGKDTLHDYLGHLEDAFLIRTVWMHSASERQRMVNPRKVYPVDPGLIAPYERTGRAQSGHALETAVLLELERRRYGVSYVRTDDGHEVDFLAVAPDGKSLLIQVAASASNATTLEREVRALETAARAHRDAECLLITLDSQPPRVGLPAGIRWVSAVDWLLDARRPALSAAEGHEDTKYTKTPRFAHIRSSHQAPEIP